MKKLITLILVLTLVLTFGACGQKAEESAQTPAAAEDNSQTEAAPKDESSTKVIGALSMLNMTEEEYAAFLEARIQIGGKLVEEGYAKRSENAPGPSLDGTVREFVFYDTLDALLMALNAGDIDDIDIYQSVALYLCAANDNLQMGIIYDMDKERNTFAEITLNGVLGNDFAFLMMEDNAALRDAFNAAIADMKADGTLERLVKEQIDGVIDGGEIAPIELPKIDGAETIKVAVTGALPPMDYVAADGTPAGFNTAVLAEIANRTGKNIEIVVVDSLGRAAALASGTVDAVFWTRTSSKDQERAAMTEAEREAHREKTDANMTEEEVNLMKEFRKGGPSSAHATADMPEGTIVTEHYFSDVLVPVMLAR